MQMIVDMYILNIKIKENAKSDTIEISRLSQDMVPAAVCIDLNLYQILFSYIFLCPRD